jgi:NAD(P)-dependent dehydrogenase (short-subunit alcohol dehydrogenase family)
VSDFQGKTILVTGASRGIGRAAAIAFGRKKAQVLLHYGESLADAESAAREIENAGGRVELLRANLATASGPLELADQVNAKTSGRLHGIVANAGISKSTPFESLSIEDFDRLFAINVRAPYFLVTQLLPLLGEGSSITFVSSLVARASVGQLAAYAATKGAVSTLTRHLAAALGSRGIRVNAVAPGVVDTDMSSFAKSDAGRSSTLGMQALQRIAQPYDLAEIFTFLASEDARWITGDIVAADGGSRL